jgi:hypothetical protein
MGTLSGLSMMALKSESLNPTTKKPTKSTEIIQNDFTLHNLSNLSRRCHFSNQSVGGKIKKKMRNVNDTRIVGFERVSIKCLNASTIIPV